MDSLSAAKVTTVIQHEVGSVQLAFELDDARIDQCDLLAAWDELLPFSAEAAIVNRPSLFEFANAHSLLFAAVLVPIVEIDEIPSPLQPQRRRDKKGERANISSPLEVRSDPNRCVTFAKILILPTQEKGDQVEQPDGTDDPSRVLRRRSHLKTAGVVYVSQSAIPQQAYIGISILPAARRKGIARRACDLALEWALNALQIHHVQARIMFSPYATHARSLFVGAGFTFEGIQRRVVADAAGEWADVMHMGILETSWCIRTKYGFTANGPWDELLERHQREAEELVWTDKHQESIARRLRRTDVAEAIHVVVEGQDLDSDRRVCEARSPCPLSAVLTAISSMCPSRGSGPSTLDGSSNRLQVSPLDTDSEDIWVQVVGDLEIEEAYDVISAPEVLS
ncbi:hypothetical protein C8Q70DRAFT_930036 [Cubamyces menziesii]|uniref:N-acetyltransferase domain-containing protein n=1 Tax=Trametes cubensis TaxID=1111947 RepID=A0AAD7U2S4_9APHY|nr:hypothetical protein C8Q70DRAFT_930036 [Cubamyces menziesii]KAJ8494680.1 hypothetical protein ONZ51_g2157 [Trametes cubensis]